MSWKNHTPSTNESTTSIVFTASDIAANMHNNEVGALNQKFLDAVRLCNEVTAERDELKRCVTFVLEECDWDSGPDDRIGSACYKTLERIDKQSTLKQSAAELVDYYTEQVKDGE